MRRVSLSVEGIGTCCSATSLGSAGGGSDWVPDIASRNQQVCDLVLNNRANVLGLKPLRLWWCEREKRIGRSEFYGIIDRETVICIAHLAENSRRKSHTCSFNCAT